jgi:transcription-repair coupling factor (superfamily II helicase)
MNDKSIPPAIPVNPPEELGEIVVGLVEAADSGDLIYIARDEIRGAEIAKGLAAIARDSEVAFCPGSDALPGEDAPPSPANVGQRVAALRRLRAVAEQPDRKRILLVATAEAAGRLYPHPQAFDTAPPILQTGEACGLEKLATDLEALGYTQDDRVDEPGEIAFRGQVLDIFPADAGEPYRIEVQDGAIASIRRYDAATQLTEGECQSLEVGRAQEPELGHGVTLLEHLPGARIAYDPGAEDRRRRFLRLAVDAGRRRPTRALRDICGDERWREIAAQHPAISLGAGIGEPPPRFVEHRNPSRAFASFARKELEAGSRLVLLGTARDLRFLARRIAKLLRLAPETVPAWQDVVAAAPGSVLLLELPLARGFRIRDIVAIAAGDLLGSRAQRGEKQAAQSGADLFSLGEIKVGDVIVHEDHGLAVVAGLETLPTGGEAIVLRFAGEARRLVPATEAHRIWRYGAEESAVTLDKLDGSTWAKRRGEIDQAVAESARGLVALAEERLKRTASVLEPDSAAYERFSAEFPFTETADQMRAITAVRTDLASGKPMDRLVIGDVGYGKTEVALRATAIAALSGKQVVLAAPTTVLARQHLETFTDRFEEMGITVAGLSRLSTPAEKKRVVAGLKDGSVQVVIGTGAVGGKGVAYHDLGLVIIDEEQRFGAADKTKLRNLGAGHVLTLSATPIPRTLQQAMIGLQQLSVIATPPARRQPIRTTVAAFDDQTVRTALLRERSRRGQSFVVVPRIEDMPAMAEKLRSLLPELELREAHGKMPAAEIDQAMVGFARGEGDVLLATNIIEAGLDVARANTMIVWKADRFGLSQLHQLRGRVGRGARRGQIYLLTEAGAEIAPRTMSRLQTLQAFDRLGSGFAISARDLDMRGAGDLLGEEQAGHVKLIGVDLYQNLLEQALRAVRGEAVEDWSPEINLGIEGYLPENWVPEQDIRIGLYSRLARLRDSQELDSFEDELADRFGELPIQAQQMLAQSRLKLMAGAANIQKIDAGPAAIALTLRPGRARPDGRSDLIEKNGRLLLAGDFSDDAARLQAAEQVLSDLCTA